MREHDLKTWPEPFEATERGEKTYEIRVDDRGFAVGDVLVLRKYDPTPRGAFGLGRYVDDAEPLRRRVTYITPGGRWGLPAHLCVMAVAPIGDAADAARGKREG